MVKSLKSLGIDELRRVIETCPWYAGARVELCERAASAGRLKPEDAALAAFYAVSPSFLFYMLRSQGGSVAAVQEPASVAVAQEPARPVAGGDYFSQEEYSAASADSLFPGFSFSAFGDKTGGGEPAEEPDAYSETLAQIYAKQGYTERAKQIYSKLRLLYPEKSVYFAALIEKLDKN